jgi:hypothetical protein
MPFFLPGFPRFLGFNVGVSLLEAVSKVEELPILLAVSSFFRVNREKTF